MQQSVKRRAALKRAALFERIAEGAHARLEDTAELARSVREPQSTKAN